MTGPVEVPDISTIVEVLLLEYDERGNEDPGYDPQAYAEFLYELSEEELIEMYLELLGD